MSEFAGLQKYKNNPACTKISKSVSLLIVKSATEDKEYLYIYIQDRDIPKVPFAVQTYIVTRVDDFTIKTYRVLSLLVFPKISNKCSFFNQQDDKVLVQIHIQVLQLRERNSLIDQQLSFNACARPFFPHEWRLVHVN